MAFTIEQECPQCGAPIELDETDHLILCPFCNVKNYLCTRDYFRLVLPHKVPDKAIIYTPYMRFKGEVYLCKGASINHSIVDITHRGTSYEQLPISLGFRPQAMKMKFVTPDVHGSVLACSLKPSDVLTIVDQHVSIFSPGKLFHQAYIGEAFSLIYLPLFVQDNRVYDAVINRPIAALPDDEDALTPPGDENPGWHISFMATLCPQCGWNLDGERDSVVLTCGNCDTAWEASEGSFIQVACGVVPGHEKDARYLPFWKITVQDEEMGITTYADLIRITRRPLVIQKAWNNREPAFWIPAFKIRPKVFLRLIRQMTIFQKDFTIEEKMSTRNLYPVTLSRSEAAKGLKVALASAVMTKRKFFPILPHINLTIKKTHLVYLPFRAVGQDMIQEHLTMSINKNTLKYGRYL